MEELRDLQKIYSLAAGRFNQYDGKDFVLPDIFKQQVREINSNTIVYNKYSAIIETRGNQNGVLNIYLPNQWFYIASYFTDFYNELQKYKKEALKVVSKERLKDLNGHFLTEEEKRRVNQLLIDDNSKNNLIRFMTDYSWWSGAKTIDRGDFYVSPILNSARLVNASQSFVADLCAFLSDKKDLIKAIMNASDDNGSSDVKDSDKILQQIFYGAPGTGKSHEIKRVTSGEEVIRTTFHPDSDYSTFVGAYKPTTQEETVMTVIGTKAVPVENADGSIRKENKIVYEFVNQAFLQAYINAWKLFADDEQNPKKQYLVIEEINRGNCAQIFGDLFQLLDRSDSGFSEYPIKTDADMEKHLSKAFKTMSYLECPSIAGISGEDVARKIRNGEIMLLPPNLYIWATMNTSDQSLFPIDSAFKRRWDWKYMPIEDANLEWIIKVNGNDYKWFEFLQAINKEVLDLTHSEDKQLGYFFAKAQNGIIDANTLVNKVYFYLWNDVFKDYDIEGQKTFRKANSNDTIAFKDFFDGLNVIESVAEQVLINLGLNKPEEPQNENIN